MNIKKAAAAAGYLLFLILNSCGEFDSVLPVNHTYQVSAMVEDHSLDEYAGIGQNDKIRPYFVHSISGDQDITGLTVFLQNPEGAQVGEKLILTAGLDRTLPYFPLPEDLEIGSYKMVFQVFGGTGKIFSKTEKTVFYLAGADYRIDAISAFLPG
jgi:hypothetical protein